MSSETRKRVDRLLLILLALGVTIGCGQQEGCGLGANTPYPEEGILVRQSMQAHLTESGIDTLGDAVVSLVGDQLGGMNGQLSFCIPPVDSTVDACHTNTTCDDGSTGCQFDATIAEVKLEMGDNGAGNAAATAAGTPDAIRAVIGLSDIHEDIPASGAGFDCIIHVDSVSAGPLPIAARLLMEIDPITERLGLVYDGISIDFDYIDIDVDGVDWWDVLPCEGVDAFALGLVTDQISGAIDPQVRPIVDGFLCVSCDAGCPSGSTCNTDDNLCYNNSNNQCVPVNFGIETEVNLSELLGGFGAPDANGLNLSIYPGNYADAKGQTLSLGIETGATATQHACVAPFPPPSGATVPYAVSLEGPNSPAGNPFDAGIGISESFLEHALWAFYTSGGMCLEISGIEQLSSGTLGVLLPSLENLTAGQNRPILMRFNPHQPPTVSIGAGKVSEDPGTGEFVLDEPLITLEVENLDIDMYLFAFDRYVRLMTVNADAQVPIGLAVTPENELVPVLGDLENALTRVEIRNAELIKEDPALIEGLLPGLIAGFLPSLAGGLSNPIALPELMGFSLTIEEITGIENNTMIGLYAGLDYTPPAGGLRIASETSARIESIELPARDHLDAAGRIDWTTFEGTLSDLNPVVTLALDGQAPAGRAGQLEYSYRIDDGLWSLFTPNQHLRLAHPTLLLPGRHRIEVRSRLQGDYRTLDATPEVLDVVIDWVPPLIEDVTLDGHLARVRAVDHVSAPAELTYRHRVAGGEWSAWQPTGAFDLTAEAGPALRRVSVDVEVRDGQANVATFTRELTLPALVAAATAPTETAATDLPLQDAADDQGCGCTTVRDGASSSRNHLPLTLSLLLVAGGLIAVRRRRRRAVPARVLDAVTLLAAVVALSWFASGCDEQAPNDNNFQVDPCAEVECPAGQTCAGGECVDPCAACTTEQTCGDANGDGVNECIDPSAACTTEADCPACADDAPALCTDGVCGCGEPPVVEPCGGSCGADAFCCESQDTCMDLPTGCDDVTCEPGFELQEGDPASGDPTSCEITPPVCECVELPELTMGRYGQFTSVAVTPEGNTLVTAYHVTYGDLLLGVANKTTELTWHFIDGVPTDAPVEGKIDGVRGGIRQGGPNVGRHTALAVATDGTLHVAYQDADDEALRYGQGTPDGSGGYTWSFHTVDAEGRTGYWTSISLDPSTGAPGIAYATLEAPDGARTVSRARYAQATGATPGAGTDWQLATLDELDLTQPCASACGSGEFCRMDTSACAAPADPTVCEATPCATGERCFDDGCAAIAVTPPAVADWPLATGLHTAQARHADGRVVVAFYDSVEGDLMVSRQPAAGMPFDAPVLFAGADHDAGMWPAVAVDAADAEHLVWVDWTRKDLVYGTGDGSIVEVIDDGARTDAFGSLRAFVGDDAELSFDDAGNAVVSYQDSTLHQLAVATRDATSGSWVQTVVAGEGRDASYEGAFGFYGDHVLSGGRAWIVNFVVDQQGSPLMQALLHDLPL